MTNDEAVNVYRTLKAAYPNTPVEPANAELWISILTDLDAPTAARTVRRWVMKSRWFPTPADFVELIDSERYDNPSERVAAIADVYANHMVSQGHAIVRGDGDRVLRNLRRCAIDNPELHRLEREYPDAPPDVIVGQLLRESNSIQYYNRIVDQPADMAEIES